MNCVTLKVCVAILLWIQQFEFGMPQNQGLCTVVDSEVSNLGQNLLGLSAHDLDVSIGCLVCKMLSDSEQGFLSFGFDGCRVDY